MEKDDHPDFSENQLVYGNFEHSFCFSLSSLRHKIKVLNSMY